MEQTVTRRNIVVKRQADDLIKIKDIFSVCVNHWSWFVISVLVCLCFAYIKVLRTPNVYVRQASVLIKESAQNSASSFGSKMKNMGELGMFNSVSDVNNELVSIQSPAIMLEVAKRLHLDYTYQVDGTFHRNTLYGETLPVEARIANLDDNQNVAFEMTLNGSSVEITNIKTVIKGNIVEDKQTYKTTLGGSVKTPAGTLTVFPTGHKMPKKATKIYVTRANLYSAMAQVKGSFRALLNGKETSIIDMTYNDVNIQRAEDVINMIITVYNESWVKDKNQVAVSTSQFIDDRLAIIEKELGTVDSDISNYKSDNLLPDIQATSAMAINDMSAADKVIRELNNQLYMARYIRDYVNNNNEVSKLMPANLGLENVAINSQINDYNNKVMQRNSIVNNSSANNPIVKDIDAQLAGLHQSIIVSLDQEVKGLNERLKSQERNLSSTTSKIAKSPQQAKAILSVERQQKVKESLYIFLLQKREENELSKAFTAYNTRIITPPMGPMAPVSPRKARILFLAFCIGIIIPMGIIILLETLNTRVRGRKDLEKLPVPYIGEIPLYTGKHKKLFGFLNMPQFGRQKGLKDYRIVVKARSRSVMNEAFRVVRTNMEFMSNGTEERTQVIMSTSCNPGSGKTFLTANLATSFAVKGKKVVILDLDLRRASVSQYVNSPDNGISNYLSGQVSECPIVPVHGVENLSIIPVGIIPPNPTELLYTSRLSKLIEKLRAEYDYIFIDCPPVDIVADSNIIAQWADMCVFVVRADLMEREMLPVIEKYYNEKKFNNMALLLNGTTSAHGRYGYQYGYGSYGSYGGYADRDE